MEKIIKMATLTRIMIKIATRVKVISLYLKMKIRKSSNTNSTNKWYLKKYNIL